MSRRQRRKLIRTLLMLGGTGTALASLVATLVWAYAPRLGHWQIAPQEIADESQSSPAPKPAWTSRLLPPIADGEGAGQTGQGENDGTIQIAGLTGGPEGAGTGGEQGTSSAGGQGGGIGGTFEQTYGNGPDFGGPGGQTGASGFGGGSSPGGNFRPLSFAPLSTSPSGPGGPGGGPGGPGGLPASDPPGNSPDGDGKVPGPSADDPNSPPDTNATCTVNCEQIAFVPPPTDSPLTDDPNSPPPPPETKPTGPTGPSGPGPFGPTFGGAPPNDNQDLPEQRITECIENCSSQTNNLIAVPEPGALALFLMGLAGLGLARRRG